MADENGDGLRCMKCGLTGVALISQDCENGMTFHSLPGSVAASGLSCRDCGRVFCARLLRAWLQSVSHSAKSNDITRMRFTLEALQNSMETALDSEEMRADPCSEPR
jgi:hypothetical protein